jgi:hypothetical protein
MPKKVTRPNLRLLRRAGENPSAPPALTGSLTPARRGKNLGGHDGDVAGSVFAKTEEIEVTRGAKARTPIG